MSVETINGVLYVAIGSLAVFACVLVFSVYAAGSVHDPHKSPAHRMIPYLLFVDVGKSVLYVVDGYRLLDDHSGPDAACPLHGVLRNFFRISSFLWILCISNYMFSTLVKSSKRISFWLYPSFAVGVPLICCIIILATGTAGLTTNGKCWIKDQSALGIVFRYSFYYVPLFAVCFISGFHAIALARKMTGNGTIWSQFLKKSAFLKIIVLFICFRAVNAIDWFGRLFTADGTSVEFLDIVQHFFSPLHGLANAIILSRSKRFSEAGRAVTKMSWLFGVDKRGTSVSLRNKDAPIDALAVGDVMPVPEPVTRVPSKNSWIVYDDDAFNSICTNSESQVSHTHP